MTGLIIVTIFTAVIKSSSCQYAIQSGLRPDVTFGDHNDRFDVTSLVRRQKGHSQGTLDKQSEKYRRRYKPTYNDQPWIKLLNSEKGRKTLRKRIKNKLEDHVNNLANTIITKIRNMRRYDDEFVYHDNMNSDGGDIEDFNTNLRAFEDNDNFKEDEIEEGTIRRQYHLQDIVNKLHGTNQNTRKSLDPEKEILLHYAFPIDMKIEGFLQAPLN